MSGLPSPFMSATATDVGAPGGEDLLVLEGAVAVTQQHAHAIAVLVG